MSKPTRRDILKLDALMGLFHLFEGCGIATRNARPDLILMNGRIATEDEQRSFAQAVTIGDGRFLAVGTDDEIMHPAEFVAKFGIPVWLGLATMLTQLVAAFY